MMRCHPDVRAVCPDSKICGPDADYADDSECARFAAWVQTLQPTRFQKLRTLDAEGLAALLMRLTAGTEVIPFCKGSPECDKALEQGDIDDSKCLGGMIRWLMSAGELP